MSWAVIHSQSAGRVHGGNVRKMTGNAIVTIHFNGTRPKDRHKCKLLRGCKFDSMRTISL